MALVLRKAVLTRNISFLKCLKGRQIATTANKNNPAPLSQAVPCRRLRDDSKNLHLGFVKIGKSRRMSLVRSSAPHCAHRMRVSVSCPTLVTETRPKIRVPLRHFSPPPLTRLACSVQSSATLFAKCTPLLQSSKAITTSKRSFSAKPCCGSPCPFPCGPCGCSKGCNCLPPPCNTPPRCIQYMTGYYYYPYGTWFCGPYHVSGTCCPVGPCGPSSCSPCGPCGPCGPCAPCGPCGPCVKCACPSTVCPGPIPPTMCTAAVNPMAAISQVPRDIPRTGVVPGNQIKSPLSQDESCRQASKSEISKSGISRFFPYDKSKSTGTRPANSPKTLPTTTVLTSCSCPYSTRAGHSNNPECCVSRINMPKSSSYTVGQQSKKCSSFAKPSSTKFPSHDTTCSNRIQAKNTCSVLEKPRALLTLEQRNRPRVKAGAFDHASIPNYRNPYPNPHIDQEFKA